MNDKKGKISVVGLGVVLLIGAVIASFFAFESHRMGELKDNLPSYTVCDSQDEAIILAIESATAIDGKYHMSSGLSNSWYLPFTQSVIVLDDAKYADLEKHDFVAYIRKDGTKVFHRLIEKTDEGWKARGDSNANFDPELITDMNYIGRLVEPIYTWKGVLIKDESILSVFDK